MPSGRDGRYTFNPQSSPVSETSQPSMHSVPAGYKKRGNHPAPVMGDYTPRKYYLVESGFLASTPTGKTPTLHPTPTPPPFFLFCHYLRICVRVVRSFVEVVTDHDIEL